MGGVAKPFAQIMVRFTSVGQLPDISRNGRKAESCKFLTTNLSTPGLSALQVSRVGKTPDSNKGSDSDMDIEGSEGYRYKQNGLVKQSFSITTSTGNHLHLISYFSRADPQQLLTPTTDPALRHIRPPPGVYPESTVHEQQSIPAVTRAPMAAQTVAYGPPGYAARAPPGVPPNPAYAQAHYPPAQWQGPPATSAPNGYHQQYPQGTGAPLPQPSHHPVAYPPVTSAPGDPGLPRPLASGHHRSGSGSTYPAYGSARPSPHSGTASLAPPMSSRHTSQANSPAGTPPSQQIDPALGHNGAPINAPVSHGGNHLPPVRNDLSTRTPSPAPSATKRDWTGTPVSRDTNSSGGTIPSIGTLMNGVAGPERSKSASPGSRRGEGLQDIPNEKMGFGEDMRALRVLDRAFKT
jgi:Gti1/Pac2 family transcription factor